MTANEQQIEELNKDYLKYKQDLDDLQQSVKEYSIAVDIKLTSIQKKLDDSYNKILNLQDKIALELKSRRL